MAYGVGDLISSLANPNANADLAQAITPNPNPLAQQGQPPAAATAGSPTMPNAATTKQDPYVGNLALMLIQNQQRARAAEGINQGMDRMAASFGTAQQQASKMAALHGGGGGAANPIGDVGDIMKIQQAVTDQNERARFMANAGVFAKIIGMPVDQTTELMNDPNALRDALQTTFQNQTKTEAVKNWEQGRAALRASGKTDAEIDATMPPEMLAFGGGADIGQTQYLQAKALATAQGKGADFPDYETWKTNHATQAKVKQDLSMDRENATQALPDVNRQLNDVEGKVDEILKDPNLDSLMGKWTPNSGFASLVTATEGQRQLAQKISNLMSTDYSQGFKIGGASRKTQFELGQLSAALNGSLGSFNLSPADYRNGLVELKNKFRTSHANAYGETGDTSSLPSSLQGYLDPSYRQGGNLAGKGAPGPLTQPSDDDRKDFATIVSKYGRQAAILHFREIGIDPSGL